MNWEVSPPRDGNQEVQTTPAINASDYWSPYDNIDRRETTQTVQPPAASDANRFRSNVAITTPPNVRWNESGGVAPYQSSLGQPRFNSQTYSAQFRDAGPRPFETPAPATYGPRPADGLVPAPVTRPGERLTPTYYPPTGGMVREAPNTPERLPTGLPANDRRLIGPNPGIPGNSPYRSLFGRDNNRPAQPTTVADNNGPGTQEAASGRRRLFQPARPVAPVVPVPPTPGNDRTQPQQPERQPPERARPLRGDRHQPQTRLTSERFNGPNETGPVAELFMPATFQKDPASDDFMRIYNEPNTTNRITMFGPTEIRPESARALQQLLNRRDGELRPNTPEYDTAAAMMGGGYHTIQRNPHISVETIAGRKMIVLSNEQNNTRAFTMFVPTDGQRYLYPVTFEGNKNEFDAVRAGFNRTQWRRTPDAPPAPPARPGR